MRTATTPPELGLVREVINPYRCLIEACGRAGISFCAALDEVLRRKSDYRPTWGIVDDLVDEIEAGSWPATRNPQPGSRIPTTCTS